jgi:hypothetical protein
MGMRSMMLGAAAAVALGLLCWCSVTTDRAAHAAEPTATPPAGMEEVDMDEAMKRFMELGTPGPHHTKLNGFVGNWKITMKCWMSGPGSEACVSSGKSTVKWILDRRYLLEEVEAEMLMPGPDGGMKPFPFRGLGLTGYDNYQNMYTSTWADSMSTAMMVMRGTWNKSGLALYGEMDEPMLEVRGRPIKITHSMIDERSHVMRMYDLHAGDDYLVMEITYERQ